MAETKIEWADYTHNQWIGCQKVSPGCKHCYAENLMDDRWKKVEWGPGKERKRTSEANWRQPLKWHAQAAAEGVTRNVFCSSLSDVFEGNDQLAEWRHSLFEMIDSTPSLNWLLLTKQPANVKTLWPFGWYDDQFTWQNIWVGTSVENQRYANLRVPELLQIPATVRFLSCEPLLGPLDLRRYLDGIHWVIIGGESGPGARAMNVEWAADIIEQCQAAGVAVFMKQVGAVGARLGKFKDRKGGDISEWPQELQVREFPAKRLQQPVNA